ncbi:hypothetical protein FRC15_003926 [Serendipita sp. 397]|nr:hypothetical protein FRC15_003926 [Serendipita sp. 397]
MPSEISYSDFQSSNGALATDSGPWLLYRSYYDDVNCGSSQRSFCTGSEYCLACWVFPSATQSSYTVSFFTTIAVKLAEYGGNTNLRYDWQYTAWWGSRRTAVGTALQMTSSVGDTDYSDNISASNATELLSFSRGWDYQPWKHSGEVNVALSPDRTMGYIPLAINLTFPRQTGDYINYFVKEVSFKITTESTPVPSPSSTSPPDPISSGSKGLPIGAFVGGIIGAAILVTGIMFLVLFCRKRGKRSNVTSNQSAGGTGITQIPVEQAPFVSPYSASSTYYSRPNTSMHEQGNGYGVGMQIPQVSHPAFPKPNTEVRTDAPPRYVTPAIPH